MREVVTDVCWERYIATSWSKSECSLELGIEFISNQKIFA